MGVKAVHLDGATYLQNDDLTALPLSSRYGFLSYWFKSSGSGNGAPSILMNSNDPRVSSTLSVSHLFNSGVSGDSLSVNLKDGLGSVLQRSSDTLVLDDGDWHHVLLAWDTQGRTCDCYLDDSSVTLGHDSGSGTFDVAYDAPSLKWTVGEQPGFNNWYTGDLAELFLLIDAAIDITDPDVRAKFIDPDTLLPVVIDARGQWPFLESHGAVPQIWLSGNQDLFPRNYPAWSTTCVSQTDSDPTSQFTVVGNLTTADDDPFGSSSVGV